MSNIHEIMGEATTVPDDKATTLKEAQIEAIARSKQTHAEWLGHSSTIAFVAKTEAIMKECADEATMCAIGKDADTNYILALLQRRAAHMSTLKFIREGFNS